MPISMILINQNIHHSITACNEKYAISIDTVKVEMVTSRGGGSEAARGLLEDEPRAIKMAKGLEEDNE
jgi:hypothetical protein